MPSIATRTGDDGTTSLLFGQRVPKHHPQIEAVGALDELNAAIGLAKSRLTTEGVVGERHKLLTAVQRSLVAIMGEVACAESDAARYAASKFGKLSQADVDSLDVGVATLESLGLKFEGWATPGGNSRAGALDFARTVARRAERHVVGLPLHGRNLRPEVRHYLNRLSDLLWLLAREAEA